MAGIDPTQLLSIWKTLHRLPGGARVFSKLVGVAAPYTGTLPFRVESLEPGRCVVRLHDRRRARNHLASLHAIALMNLGEVSTGLAMYSALPRGGRGILKGLAMRYTKKARGPIMAEAVVTLPTEPGKHDLQITASLRDASGDVVAEAEATWRIELPG